MPLSSSSWRVWRRVSQGFWLALFAYILWNAKYPLHGLSNPKLFFQFDPLVMAVTSLAERLWLPGLIWAATTLVLTLVFGRVFCGWFCPLGTLQDGMAHVGRRIRRYREGYPGWPRLVKYGLALGLAAAAVLGWQGIWLFDPLAIFVRSLSFTVYPFVNHAVAGGMAWLVQATGFSPPVEDAYYFLRDQALDIRQTVFPHAGLIFALFAAILAAVLAQRRWWCRVLCPLGGMLGAVAKVSWLKRVNVECGPHCRTCQHVCRTNAILPDQSYLAEECVVCLDCMDSCPGDNARFEFILPRAKTAPAAPLPGPKLSRGQFLGWLGGALALSAAGCAGQPDAVTGGTTPRPVVRPPAALPESEFVQRCVRCGNCMKVCLTNVLQPAVLESGWEGIWTPKLDPAIGYCEYHCTLCGQVCPTGAIPRISEPQKLKTKLGLAAVNRVTCIPWTTDRTCIVCEEHCPTSPKAIRVETVRLPDGKSLGRPIVDANQCVGCMICEVKCPVKPKKAITVTPV